MEEVEDYNEYEAEIIDTSSNMVQKSNNNSGYLRYLEFNNQPE